MKPILVAEIGINHNGNIKIAKSLISLAKNFGADYVKFQKKTPDICVPDEQKNVMTYTVFEPMKYIDYKKKMEFGKEEYDEIDEYCKLLDIKWFASVWDIPSLEFITKYNPPFIKIASPSLTNFDLLDAIRDIEIPIIMSTGMANQDIIDEALEHLGDVEYILHTTSSYPTPNDEMNMRAITTMKERYKYKIGFSNHSQDIIHLVQAYVMGAEMLEFHITLDRNMNGTDQKASIGPTGFDRLMHHLDNIDKGFGDGKLKIMNSEYPIIKKLRY